jgi:hypothetical protein
VEGGAGGVGGTEGVLGCGGRLGEVDVLTHSFISSSCRAGK